MYTIFAATDIFKSPNSVFWVSISKLSWLQLRFLPSPFSRIGRVNRKSPPCSAVWEPTITILFDQTSWEKLRQTRAMMIDDIPCCQLWQDFNRKVNKIAWSISVTENADSSKCQLWPVPGRKMFIEAAPWKSLFIWGVVILLSILQQKTLCNIMSQ